MTKTEYLFGYPKDKYEDFMHLTNLCNERIKDAKALWKELDSKIDYNDLEPDEGELKLRRRLSEVAAAISVWQKVLEIER